MLTNYCLKNAYLKIPQKGLAFCVECSAKNPFVYDNVHAHYTCTNCGIVPTNVIPEESMGYSFQNQGSGPGFKPRETREDMTSNDASVGDGNRTTKGLQRKQNKLKNTEKNVKQQFFKEENKKDKFCQRLDHFGLLIECNERIITKCQRIIERFPKILDIRGMDNTAIALLIIATQRSKLPMSVKMAQQLTIKKNISKRVKQLCKILGVRIATVGISNMNKVCSSLGIKFKDKKRIEATFRRLKQKHQNVGEATLLGLSIYWIVHHKKDDPRAFLGEVSELTGTTKNTLNGYLNKPDFFV